MAEDDGFEVPLRFVVLHVVLHVVSRRIPIMLMKRHNINVSNQRVAHIDKHMYILSPLIPVRNPI